MSRVMVNIPYTKEGKFWCGGKQNSWNLFQVTRAKRSCQSEVFQKCFLFHNVRRWWKNFRCIEESFTKDSLVNVLSHILFFHTKTISCVEIRKQNILIKTFQTEKVFVNYFYRLPHKIWKLSVKTDTLNLNYCFRLNY